MSLEMGLETSILFAGEILFTCLKSLLLLEGFKRSWAKYRSCRFLYCRIYPRHLSSCIQHALIFLECPLGSPFGVPVLNKIGVVTALCTEVISVITEGKIRLRKSTKIRMNSKAVRPGGRLQSGSRSLPLCLLWSLLWVWIFSETKTDTSEKT